MTWLRGLVLVLLAALGGCSESRVAAPVRIDPEKAAQEAMKQLDANGDGYLDDSELAKAPGLLSCLKEWDTDQDGKLSKAEIAAGLAPLRTTEIGLLSVTCRVYLDEKPLSGATVTLVPEKFLGPEMKTATGLSDAEGRVILKVPGQEFPGVAGGIYRIEVSRKDASGQESVPPRYNSETVLGKMVGIGQILDPNASRLVLRLSSAR